MLSMSDGGGDAQPLWLGLDLSTQSLTGAVLRGEGVGGDFNEPVVLESVNYEVGMKRKLRVFFGDHARKEIDTSSIGCGCVLCDIMISSTEVAVARHEAVSFCP